MSNIDKRADSVSRIIADLKLKHGSGDTYAPIMRWDELLSLLDELEAKDKSISFLKDQLAQLANFNPDWDKLEAATDSLREHMAELTAARKRIAELEAREVNGRFPLPKDSSQGWKIDPEFIGKIQDAIGYDEECQCWEGSPSMEMVEAVLIAAAAIKMDERG
ncbi:TPA: hypothetical protein JG893_004531 [Enterobacter hormaechei subsp. steigerwaltii]|nr:hypothetical protein [Enterobacter hormaechei subsp. steigerwaltii]